MGSHHTIQCISLRQCIASPNREVRLVALRTLRHLVEGPSDVEIMMNMQIDIFIIRYMRDIWILNADILPYLEQSIISGSKKQRARARAVFEASTRFYRVRWSEVSEARYRARCCGNC